jgi:hypothetical protein
MLPRPQDPRSYLLLRRQTLLFDESIVRKRGQRRPHRLPNPRRHHSGRLLEQARHKFAAIGLNKPL